MVRILLLIYVAKVVRVVRVSIVCLQTSRIRINQHITDIGIRDLQNYVIF